MPKASPPGLGSMQTRCIVCSDETNYAWRGCEDHGLCSDCFREHAWRLRESCFCGKALQSGAASRRSRPTPVERSLFHKVVEEAFVNRCPHCQQAFVDFSGCAAVVCECGGVFCALCLSPFKTDKDCHAHVRICRLNPSKNDEFVSTAQLRKIEHTRKLKRAWAILLHHAYHHSLMHSLCVLNQLRFLDGAAILPYHFRGLMKVHTYALSFVAVLILTRHTWLLWLCWCCAVGPRIFIDRGLH